MRHLLVFAATLLALTGCYHTTVVDMPDGQKLVSFVNDSPPPFTYTSLVSAEDVTLWRASSACPAGFKVTREIPDLGSYPNTYSVVVTCKVPIAPMPAPVETPESR